MLLGNRLLPGNQLGENPKKCDVTRIRMEVVRGVSTDESNVESDLMDLTGISLEKIALLPDSALAASLRRILTDSSDATEGYAGFQDHI